MTKKVRESKYSKLGKRMKESKYIPGSQETWFMTKDQTPAEKELEKELETKFQDLKEITEQFWKKHPGKRITPKYRSSKLEYENKLEITIPKG
jgi:hypothetical protein